MAKDLDRGVIIDPVARTDALSIMLLNSLGNKHAGSEVANSRARNSGDYLIGSLIAGPVILSRAEVQRLRHQLDRWLNWDRDSQGTPRHYTLIAKDVCHSSGNIRQKARSK